MYFDDLKKTGRKQGDEWVKKYINPGYWKWPEIDTYTQGLTTLLLVTRILSTGSNQLKREVRNEWFRIYVRKAIGRLRIVCSKLPINCKEYVA